MSKSPFPLERPAVSGAPESTSSGQSLVEFAVMGALLITILLGTVDLARAFYVQTVLKGAVAEGAYYIAQNPVDMVGVEQRIMGELVELDDATTRTTIEIELGGHAQARTARYSDVSDYTTIVENTAECGSVNQNTTITVVYQHDFLFASVLPASSIALTASTSIPQFGSC
jgi:Flp pilus assembly protein TadG